MQKTTITILGGLAILIGALAGYTVGTQWNQKKGESLTIIHVNDTHSHLEPERSGQEAGQGGALERAVYIDSVRSADGPNHVLLLHAGDFCQGTSYFTELKGKTEVACLNAMQYDVVTLGNHEFDNGIEALGTLLSGLQMPVVVCNYDFSPFEAGKYIRPYVIIEKAGKKIGVVGVLCNLKDMLSGDVVNRIPSFDVIPTVQKYADLLHESCDMVIALTHIGYTEHNPGDITDPILAAATRNINLIVGGHSHTFLDQPAMVKNLDGKPVPIVQSGWMGVQMGELHVKL